MHACRRDPRNARIHHPAIIKYTVTELSQLLRPSLSPKVRTPVCNSRPAHENTYLETDIMAGKLLNLSATVQCPTATRYFQCLTSAPLRRGTGASAPCQPFQRTSVRQYAIEMAHPLVSPQKKPLYDIYIKGSPEKGEVGDCKLPFSEGPCSEPFAACDAVSSRGLSGPKYLPGLRSRNLREHLSSFGLLAS